MKKLKDKVWKQCTIKISKLVEQYQDGIGITNKTKMFLITIDFGYGRKTMFNATNIKELWKHTKKVLLFTIPIDKDFTKIVQLNRKVPGACGKTLITHVSHKTLDKILKNFFWDE